MTIDLAQTNGLKAGYSSNISAFKYRLRPAHDALFYLIGFSAYL